MKMGSLAPAASGASAAASAESGENKVVYHLADREKIAMALGNIQNHFNAFSDGGQVVIALVVIGEPLGDFRLGANAGRTTAKLRGLVDKGLTPYACAKFDGLAEIDARRLGAPAFKSRKRAAS